MAAHSCAPVCCTSAGDGASRVPAALVHYYAVQVDERTSECIPNTRGTTGDAIPVSAPEPAESAPMPVIAPVTKQVTRSSASPAKGGIKPQPGGRKKSVGKKNDREKNTARQSGR
jgi:hypothetical protein